MNDGDAADAAAVGNAAAGARDVRAFTQLAAELRTFVQHRVRDEHTAEDLTQDVLTRFAAQLASKDPPRDPTAWLFRVARNAIVDHYRKRQPATGDGDDLGALALAVADEPVVDGLAQLRASFRQFVHELPGPDREAVLLTEYEGLTQQQLADRLGIPLSTAKSRVQRARARLAAALHRCCTFELDRRGGIVDYHRRGPGDCCGDA